MPVTRLQAIALAMQAAKAHPEPYMGSDFQPHPWVVTAIMLAAADSLRPQMVNVMAVKKSVLSAAFGINSLPERELFHRLEELCIEGIGIGASGMRDALAHEIVAELPRWHGTAHHPVAEALHRISSRLQNPADDAGDRQPAQQPAQPDPTEPGWYVVTAENLDSPKVRAFGRDRRWWTPLGRGDGQDGWMTSPCGYRWFGPIADIDEQQPFLHAAQQAPFQGAITDPTASRRPEPPSEERNAFIGAHIEGGKFYANVTRRDRDGVVTVVAIAEADASLLASGGLAGPMAPAIRTDVLSDAQINAGAAITTLDGKPVGRNVAIDVFHAMSKAGQEGGAA